MKDYYRILGLKPDASFDEIKKAYRTLAKRYHPDSSHHLSSEGRFIEVNEAYEFLADPVRRSGYKGRPKISPEEAKRREDIYRQWVQNQQDLARRRAQRHSRESFDKFSESSIYKTAMLVSRVYNYIFFAVGVALTIVPVTIMIFQAPSEEEDQRQLWEFILPVVLGGLFTYGIYYFLFKLENDE